MKLITEYREEFDNKAFQLLSKSSLKNEDSLCSYFNCSKVTLAEWKSIHKSFADSIEIGIIIGEQNFKALLLSLSLLPGNSVNTKLLSILASNVYGINEEKVTSIDQHVSYVGDPETVMKRKGIPIPEIELADMETY